ncbi:MAG: ABC transporter ATP-binding protein, partial [Acidimicrobiia bacterium]|nr:ABC transporter ATP-binding protein [Acidimicrobiia bacterium]
RGLIGMFYAYAQNRVVQNAGASVSALIHRRYLEAPYRFHLERRSAESVRTVLWSVDSATNGALNPMINIVSQVIITTALVSLLIAISPVLSIVAIGVLIGTLTLIFMIVQPMLGRLGKLSEDTIAGLLASVRNSFDSIRDIKAYRTESHFDNEFRIHRKVIAKLRITKALLEEIPANGLEFVIVLGLLVLVGVARQGDTFSELIPVIGAFAYATLRIMPSLNKIVRGINKLKFAQQSVVNVEADLRSALPDEATSRNGAASPGRLFDESITLRDVSFTYPGAETKAVDCVDLEIRRGEMMAIVGESGSGKSTLVDIILGLLDPDEGRILLDGSDSLPTGWHRHIGIVSQSVILLDDTLRANVAFGAGEKADDAKVHRALERAGLGDRLAAMPEGLDTPAGESGKLLSGGERQRVAIARSLYRDPDLLLLDEATSALDGATEAELIETLVKLSDEVTTVIVSHRIAPVRAAKRVAVMAGGRLEHVGAFDDLVEQSTEFRRLVGEDATS